MATNLLQILIVVEHLNKSNAQLETAESKMLLQWIAALKPPSEVHMLEIFEDPAQISLTEGVMDSFGPRILNKFLDFDYYRVPYRIIAVGDVASYALELINVDHFLLPAPSATNPNLKKKKYVAKMLNECYAFIHEHKNQSEGPEDEDSYFVQIANERNRKLV